MSKTVALFDLGYLFRRYWHAFADKELNEARSKTTAYIAAKASDYDLIAICRDSPPYIRQTIFPEYKANREKPSAVMIEQMRLTMDDIRNWGYHVIGVKEYEADDVIMTLSRLASEKEWTVEVYTVDKDILQALQFRGVTVIDPVSDNKRTAQDIIDSDKYGIPPQLIPDWLALIGDKSDNMPGLDGVGPKTATRWLNHFGSLGALMDNYNADESPVKERFREKLGHAETRSNLIKMQTLATLSADLPIKIEALQEPVADMELAHVTNEQNGQLDNVDNEQAGWHHNDRVITTEMTIPEQDSGIRTSALTVKTSSYNRQLEPTTTQGAWALAEKLHSSQLFAQKLGSPEKILAVIIDCRSRGIPAVTALRSAHIIGGKIGYSTELVIGQVKSSPLCEYFDCIETTAEQATWATKRVNSKHETKLTFAMADAKAAGYTAKNPNYTKVPKNMLRWRAAMDLARMVYPDITAGFYSVDELVDSK